MKKLAQCQAVRALVPLAKCVECAHHVDGASCPHLSRVIPSAYCHQECKHNMTGTCEHPNEKARAVREDKPCREVMQVWDDYAPMCALPRLIALADLYEGEEV